MFLSKVPHFNKLVTVSCALSCNNTYSQFNFLNKKQLEVNKMNSICLVFSINSCKSNKLSNFFQTFFKFFDYLIWFIKKSSNLKIKIMKS